MCFSYFSKCNFILRASPGYLCKPQSLQMQTLFVFIFFFITFCALVGRFSSRSLSFAELHSEPPPQSSLCATVEFEPGTAAESV